MKILFIIVLSLTQISVKAQVFNYFNMDTTRSKNFIVLKPKEKSVRENAKMNVQWNFTRDRELLLVLDSVSRHVFLPERQDKARLLKKLAVYAFFDHSLYLRSFEFIIPKNDPDVPLSDVLSMEKELLNYVKALKQVSVKDFGYAEKPEEFRLGIMRFKVLN